MVYFHTSSEGRAEPAEPTSLVDALAAALRNIEPEPAINVVDR